MAIIHGIVMGRFDYDRYDVDYNLVYDDVKNEYPRKTILFESGKNTLSAYLYGEDNEKGIIVVAPGHTDPNDIKLYEIRYFVDAGYSVICFDYTGCYTSECDSFGGYTQAVYDLDALLNYVENSDEFEDKLIYLFGHSDYYRTYERENDALFVITCNLLVFHFVFSSLNIRSFVPL